MLFQNIAKLAAKGITISMEVVPAEDGKLEVNVLPTTQSGKSGFNLVAKSFVATPQELDAEFADVINGFATVNLSLKEQLDQVEAAAAEVAKQAAEASKVVAKSKPVPKPGVGPTAKRAGPELSDDSQDDVDEYPSTETGQTAQMTAEPAPFML